VELTASLDTLMMKITLIILFVFLSIPLCIHFEFLYIKPTVSRKRDIPRSIPLHKRSHFLHHTQVQFQELQKLD